jgi:hypothetical protein
LNLDTAAGHPNNIGVKMEVHDVCDDDYWKNLDGRRGRERAVRFGAAMNRLDVLSRKLTEESYQEYLKEEERRKEKEQKPGSNT